MPRNTDLNFLNQISHLLRHGPVRSRGCRPQRVPDSFESSDGRQHGSFLFSVVALEITMREAHFVGLNEYIHLLTPLWLLGLNHSPSYTSNRSQTPLRQHETAQYDRSTSTVSSLRTQACDSVW